MNEPEIKRVEIPQDGSLDALYDAAADAFTAGDMELFGMISAEIQRRVRTP